MRNRVLLSLISVLLLSSCTQTRIKEHKEWGKYFEQYGLKNACFILRDHTHESVHYYNKEQCTKRIAPANTFNIFNTLVALQTDIAPSDDMIIKWDSVVRPVAAWNKDLTLREAFAVKSMPFYKELARRIGKDKMQHYLDTIKYGNMQMDGGIDTFWMNNSLKISADEQVGFLKQLYFDELPFAKRTQRLVRSMLLQADSFSYKLSYQTGTAVNADSNIYWLVGYIERIEDVDEPKASMNKSNIRLYPYFFAENFEVLATDSSKDWDKVRMEIAHHILKDFGAIPTPGSETPAK